MRHEPVAYRFSAAGAHSASRELGAAAVALIGIVTFTRRMLRVADPLIPPALFRRREFTVTNLATVLLYAALAGRSTARILLPGA